jgi:hypothetical protein
MVSLWLQPAGTLVARCRTLDQGKSVVTFLDAASEKTLRSTVALTASRGRGKVSAHTSFHQNGEHVLHLALQLLLQAAASRVCTASSCYVSQLLRNYAGGH